MTFEKPLDLKLLVVLSRLPWPLEKGDKLRAWHQIRCLSARHDITLVAIHHGKISDGAVEKVKEICKEVHVIKRNLLSSFWSVLIAFLQGRPLQSGYFYSTKADKLIKKLLHTNTFDHLYCQLVRTTAYAENTTISKTIDFQDAFAHGVYRRMKKSGWYLRPFLYIEYRLMKAYEYHSFELFDHHSIISLPDRNLIAHPQRNTIEIIENGVDFQYFIPMDIPKSIDLVFTGNMAYPPNIDAAEFLVKEVLTLIINVFPDIKICIAGANPHPRVRALASKNTEVTGWVDDLRLKYAASKIFIAPMQIGTGLQNKLLEAMAMGIPCITSPLANDSLQGENGKHLLLASKPSEYASQIIFLLENKPKSEELALGGNAFVKHNFNWENSTYRLEKLFIECESF